MLRYINFSVFALLSLFCFADNTFCKKAINYRDDINSSVLEELQSKSKEVLILHSDYIEEPLGRIYTLNGQEIATQYRDYLTYKGCYNLLKLYLKKEKKSGVINLNGEIIVPPVYDYITLSGDGYIEAINSDMISKNEYQNTIILFTLDGDSITSLSCRGMKQQNFAFSTYYHDNENIIEIQHKINDKKKMYSYYYPDGTMVIEPITSNDIISMRSDSYGNSYLEVLNKKHDKFILPNDPHHQKTLISYTDVKKLYADKYIHNEWISRANSFFQSERWRDALYCLDYYRLYENTNRMSSIPEGVTYSLMWLRCKYELGEYEDVYNLSQKNILQDFGLFFDKKKKTINIIQNCFNLCRSDSDLSVISDGCESIYEDCYNAVVEQKKIEKKEKNARFWGAVLDVVAYTLGAVASSPSVQGNSSNQSSSTIYSSGLNLYNTNIDPKNNPNPISIPKPTVSTDGSSGDNYDTYITNDIVGEWKSPVQDGMNYITFENDGSVVLQNVSVWGINNVSTGMYHSSGSKVTLSLIHEFQIYEGEPGPKKGINITIDFSLSIDGNNLVLTPINLNNKTKEFLKNYYDTVTVPIKYKKNK